MAPRTLVCLSENISVPVKELIPIVIAAELWGHCWARKRILFHSDNLAVVCTLQSGELATSAVLNNFTFSAKHVPGEFKAFDHLVAFVIILFDERVRKFPHTPSPWLIGILLMSSCDRCIGPEKDFLSNHRLH